MSTGEPHAGRAEHASEPVAAASGWIDPVALSRIKNLQIRARVAVEGFVRGIHKSPFHGFSVEFSEYRQYSPGDDPRYLDWRLYARSDRHYIKRFEDETNLRTYLVLDSSRSMTYGSGPLKKCDYARTAAATLAYFLTTQRDAVGLALFDERIVEFIPPRYRPGQLRRIMGVLEREPAGRATDLGTPLEQVAATARKRGLVIILSDLLAPTGLLANRLGALRARGHEVLLLRILDPAEITFPFRDAARFRDVESGREIILDPARARAEYMKRFTEHAAELKRLAVELGIDHAQISTADPLEVVLFQLLGARARRGRTTGRGHAKPGAMR